MGLQDYFRKRNFNNTPEPAQNETAPADERRRRFVVQEHHASQLHYDFRLEMDGVLKSWAVPKGPSMDPHDHHLAIQTEDHPYSYRNFEGVIPEHNYGAGNVIIWDEGWYVPRDPVGSVQSFRDDLEKGHLTFVMYGKKLQGEFALIRMPHAKEKNAWLLIKKGDEFASSHAVLAKDTSVRTRKRVDDLGAHEKLPAIDTYPRKEAPWVVRPMLCTLVDEPFDREGWLFEVKWDGYRAIATRQATATELYSRNHLDFSTKYPPVVEALATLKHEVVLDGEIVVVDKEGMPHFEWLQNWHRAPQGELRYQVFDILWCDGHDVSTMPLFRRKALLKSILPANTLLRYNDDIETHGIKLFQEMQQRGIEGMVAKRAASMYREAERGTEWLKVKTGLRQEVVIGGYTEPRGSRAYLGSLLVGVYDKGELVFVGHSGGGIPDADRQRLRDTLRAMERKTTPFATPPHPNAPVHWVRPELVCEMAFSEWTADNRMRQPEFKGLRPDKDPRSVRREKITSTRKIALTLPDKAMDGLPFSPTHLDKVFFPKHGYTKGDLFRYYGEVAEYILPYMLDRPISLNRMPDGITGESFFQKNNEHLPDWASSSAIFSASNNATLRWLVGSDLAALLYAVQLGSIEINVWNSRVSNLEYPDWLVIDLDPEGVRFKKVIEVAQTVHEVCEDWHVSSYLKTSGKTGLHIYIPTQARYTHEQCKNLAHLIVLEVNKRQPKLTSLERSPAKREHRIYLDYLQNREGQTLATAYSVRPTPDASVSTPLHWDEVKQGLDPHDFTIRTMPARLKQIGDIWKPVLSKGVDLPTILKRLETN